MMLFCSATYKGILRRTMKYGHKSHVYGYMGKDSFCIYCVLQQKKNNSLSSIFSLNDIQEFQKSISRYFIYGPVTISNTVIDKNTFCSTDLQYQKCTVKLVRA